MDDIEFSSDFENIEGNVHIVSKVSGKTWEIVELTDISNSYPRKRMLKLPAGNDHYQFFGIVVPDNMNEDEICEAATKIELSLFATNISIICRQKHTNPKEVMIECARLETVTERLQHLDSLGFTEGPAESTPVHVTDGEEISFTFESNLFLERFKDLPFKIRFFNNFATEKISGNLMVVDKSCQIEDERYHGFLKYDILQNRIHCSRSGSMVLYLPKPPEELLGNFALDVPAKAVAKFIAWQLTRDNFNSTRWVRHAGYLTNDSDLYRQICKSVDDMRPKAPQRDRFEMFLVYWITNIANADMDKVKKLITAHRNTELETEASKFVNHYLPGKGMFSNDRLEKMAYAIVHEWETIATDLGFSTDEINNINISHGLKIKQSLQMLDIWRLSDYAVHKGLEIEEHFCKIAKKAKCRERLLHLIYNGSQK